MVTIARADTVSVDLAGLVNSDLTTYAGGGNYPQHGGTITVDDIPFTLATVGPHSHTGVIQSSISMGAVQAYPFELRVGGITTVYALINSAFGVCGTAVGQLNFVGSSSMYVYRLTEGVNVRDHYEGGFCNSVTDVGGTAKFGPDRLDMLKIVLPHAFASETLEAIDFVSYGEGLGGAPFLAAVTLDPVPEPVSWPLGLMALAAIPLARRHKRQP